MIGSKALKILLKNSGTSQSGLCSCPMTNIDVLGRPRDVPDFLSRIFSTFGTNHEYESSCLCGPKYQSSKLLSLRSELFAALKIGKYLVRPRLKSHKDISSKPKTRQRCPSFQNGKNFQSEKNFFLNFFFTFFDCLTLK